MAPRIGLSADVQAHQPMQCWFKPIKQACVSPDNLPNKRFCLAEFLWRESHTLTQPQKAEQSNASDCCQWCGHSGKSTNVIRNLLHQIKQTNQVEIIKLEFRYQITSLSFPSFKLKKLKNHLAFYWNVKQSIFFDSADLLYWSGLIPFPLKSNLRIGWTWSCGNGIERVFQDLIIAAVRIF